METQKLLELINKNQLNTIDKLLDYIPDLVFHEYLETLIIEKGISKSELIKKANIDRTYGYQILSGKKKPSRYKVIMLALALQLSLDKTNNLLSLSDNGALYPKVKFDALIIFALQKHYTIIETNILLDSYDQELLS